MSTFADGKLYSELLKHKGGLKRSIFKLNKIVVGVQDFSVGPTHEDHGRS